VAGVLLAACGIAVTYAVAAAGFAIAVPVALGLPTPLPALSRYQRTAALTAST